MGKKEEAIKCFEQAIEFNQNFYIAYYNKGVALAETGKKEDGVILGIIAVRSGRKPLRGPCVLAGQHNMLSHKMSFLGDTRYSEQWQEEFF